MHAYIHKTILIACKMQLLKHSISSLLLQAATTPPPKKTPKKPQKNKNIMQHVKLYIWIQLGDFVTSTFEILTGLEIKYK